MNRTIVDEETRLGRNNPFNYLLRDAREDEVRAQPCEVCETPLRSYKGLVAHEVRHVQEGTLVGVATRLVGLIVNLVPPTEVKWLTTETGAGVVIPFEHLDWSTNGCRVACPACGDFAYLTYRDGRVIWGHYPRMRWAGRDWVRDGEEYIPDHEVELPLPTARTEG